MYGAKKEVELKASPLVVESWDTRTRTKNDRTRICSVTITPYPNFAQGKRLCRDFKSWDTRTRTKNDRTRICSVTITPYPNIIVATRSLIASAKVLINFELTMFLCVFFAETSYFS